MRANFTDETVRAKNNRGRRPVLETCFGLETQRFFRRKTRRQNANAIFKIRCETPSCDAWRMRVTVDRSVEIYLSHCFFLNKSPQRITINYDDTVCETPFMFGRENTIISLKTYWGFSHFDGVLFSRKHRFPSLTRQGPRMGTNNTWAIIT